MKQPMFRFTSLKTSYRALTGVARVQWRPIHRKVRGSIPGLGTHLGFGYNAGRSRMGGNPLMGVSLSHIDVSLFFFLSQVK